MPPASTGPQEDQFADQEWTFLNGEIPANETDGSPPSHGDADTFESSSPWPSPLAICSQISALRISVGREPSPPDKKVSHEKNLFLIHLPDPRSLQHLLQVFFREFDCYFPCLHRTNMTKRLSGLLSFVKYGESNAKVWIGCQHYKSMGILCSALAFGSPFITSSDTGEWRPGWKNYLQGKQLMQHFEGCGEDDLDVVTYHTLSAGFLLHSETLRFASHHVVQGFQAALNIGLNNQNHCRDLPYELASRKSLWWILYFLDKRITQKSGIAYFIRESEVAVDDFRDEITTSTEGAPQAFLQSMITHSTLWTYIWDNFFAPHAPKAGNWEEIQMVDARIVILHQQNASQLHWGPEQIDQSRQSGETECQIRRRLLVYLRHKYLRLSIRHTKLSEDSAEMERRQSCFHLARDIVEAIAQYMSFYSSYRPSGYVLTSSLVECIYHVVPQYRDRSSPLDHHAIESTLRKAGNLLRSLSQTVGAASRALQALQCVLRNDETPTESIYGYQALPTFDEVPSWTNKFWDLPETRQSHGCLDNTAQDLAVPATFKPLQNSTTSTIPMLSDGAGAYNSFHAPSQGSSFPALFYNGATNDDLDHPGFDLELGRTQIV